MDGIERLILGDHARLLGHGRFLELEPDIGEVDGRYGNRVKSLSCVSRVNE